MHSILDAFSCWSQYDNDEVELKPQMNCHSSVTARGPAEEDPVLSRHLSCHDPTPHCMVPTARGPNVQVPLVLPVPSRLLQTRFFPSMFWDSQNVPPHLPPQPIYWEPWTLLSWAPALAIAALQLLSWSRTP